MDYEKKYKETLNKAKELITTSVAFDRFTIETIFPELKENEDEKIRKVLIDYFKRYKEQEECGIKTFYGIPADDILAWLEKQGEQKPQGKSALEAINEEKVDNANKVENEIEIPYGAKDSELIEESYNIPKGFHAEIDKDKVVIKKGEKPAWSEEDEEILNLIIARLQSHPDVDLEEYSKEYDWLNSPKARSTWKPSDAQMDALEHFVRSIGESGYASLCDSNTKLIYSLLDQLKKL